MELADNRPDRLGDYRMITDLRLTPLDIAQGRMFRVAGWEIALVVTGDVKVRLEAAGVTGLTYELVS